MPNHRISHIALDETTILKRNEDIEQERKVAMFDLLEENTLRPLRIGRGRDGPWRVTLAVRDGRLALDIAGDSAGEDDGPAETLVLGLARFRRPVREYFAICNSYYRALRKASAREIETIDMARRAIHDQAAKLLLERLDGKIETDFATARRLFTLICVLHIKG